MKKILAAAVVVAFGIVAIAADQKKITLPAAMAQSQATKSPDQTLDRSHDGKTVAVKVGETVAIELAGNISTGYSWNVESVSSGSAKQNGKVAYVNPPQVPNSPPIVGRSGVFVANFDAVKAGKVTIKLEYKRPWDKTTPPAKTYTITLDVK